MQESLQYQSDLNAYWTSYSSELFEIVIEDGWPSYVEDGCGSWGMVWVSPWGIGFVK